MGWRIKQINQHCAIIMFGLRPSPLAPQSTIPAPFLEASTIKEMEETQFRSLNRHLCDWYTCEEYPMHIWSMLTGSQQRRIFYLVSTLHKMPCASKAGSQQFTRRKHSLIKKADQLAQLCHADLALIICRNGRYYTYRSLDRDSWPPSIIDIVRIFLHIQGCH